MRDYVDVISTRAGKLGEMINSLFSLAKASSGNVELHKETFELNRLMEQIFADMDDRIKESGLKFVTQLTEEDTAIYSDNSYFLPDLPEFGGKCAEVFGERNQGICQDV